MNNFILLVFRVGHELLQFGDIFPGFAKVERTKVEIKGLILKILHKESDTESTLK